MYLWNGTSWINEGLSAFDKAIEYVNTNILNGYRIISNEKNLLLLVDANENEILSVGLDGSIFVKILMIHFKVLCNHY